MGTRAVKGRRVPISVPRGLITDFAYLSQGYPRATVLGRIRVAELAAARAAAPPPRLPWPVLFAKAFALAARELPPLRRVYVKLPWPHLYELPASVACVVVEREHRGEPALFFCRLKDPAAVPLAALAARLAEAKAAPLGSVKDHRVALRVGRLPWPLRRALLWLALNLGRQVPNYFGTFGVSALGGRGAAIAHAVAPWASLLNYGPIGPDGTAEVYLGFDHRVVDGALAARAIRSLERALQGPVLAELRAQAAAARAA
jgi:hypothetical protein